MVNAPYIWLPLCLLFILLSSTGAAAPDDPLDLVVILALERAVLLQPGEISESVAVYYPSSPTSSAGWLLGPDWPRAARGRWFPCCRSAGWR